MTFQSFHEIEFSLNLIMEINLYIDHILIYLLSSYKNSLV
jgi:hypothetical protein